MYNVYVRHNSIKFHCSFIAKLMTVNYNRIIIGTYFECPTTYIKIRKKYC